MTAEAETQKTETSNANAGTQSAPKPTNPAAVRKVIALGKEMCRQPDTSKADVARKMFEAIADEPREVLVQAFVDGARVTPKGAHAVLSRRRTFNSVSAPAMAQVSHSPLKIRRKCCSDRAARQIWAATAGHPSGRRRCAGRRG